MPPNYDYYDDDDNDDGDDDGGDDDHDDDDFLFSYFYLQNLLAEGTHDWGVKVERVEVISQHLMFRSDQN